MLPSKETIVTIDNVTSSCCDVYRGRGRYVDEDFDLDLTYITERIIGECVYVCVYVCVHCTCVIQYS